ncbi:hypothetical protein [Streptomyces diastatochromogenes]|uniref:hypothetical protein n=1 Tax=Streptomyces diastatochromogenes TaxID=42236 RepID=UPI00117F7285|nr:hypothetical protein [Streptomyces diastatochromogenes]MCZ0990376.1 hypothetical protein [Streptomyces diastatochromogenes]
MDPGVAHALRETFSMSVQAQAAVISGIAAFVGVLVGEIFLRQRTRQARKQSIESTFETYAQPIAASSSELFWRLRELFGRQRDEVYLKGHEHFTNYEHYKATSTLYRIAGLIAWIRALRRELVYIPGSKPSKVKELDKALQAFTSALADGGHVEVRRVESLIRALDIDAQFANESIARSGSILHRQVDHYLHEQEAVSVEHLTSEQQRGLARILSKTLMESLDCDQGISEKIEESINSVMAALAVREAYVYRDWQSAIGDLMLREVGGGQRQFEVLGFKEFESICSQGREEDKLWLRRLNAVIDDLDTSGDREKDARITQLYEVYLAAARIIMALDQSKAMKSRISDVTLIAAQEVASQRL